MARKPIRSPERGHPIRDIVLLALLALCLCACGGTKKSTPSRGGGYYKNDGPPVTKPPVDLAKLPDAVPKAEPLHGGGANRPYKINGRSYTPRTAVASFRERGVASWYGKAFHGKTTSNGEIYNMYAMTAAHPTLPIPSYIRVTNVSNSRTVVVRINDRGPFHGGRIVDLSYAAAHKLDYINAGKADVVIEQIVPGAETMVTVVSNTGSSSGHYYLQLGAFSTQSNASSFMSGILNAVSRFARQIDIVDEGKIFRVLAGPFATQPEARAALDVLGRTVSVTGFVVQR